MKDLITLLRSNEIASEIILSHEGFIAEAQLKYKEPIKWNGIVLVLTIKLTAPPGLPQMIIISVT